MSFFGSSNSDKNKEEIVVFSGMDGQIVFNGEPVPNAKVTLYLKWKDQQGETHIVNSDDNGFFSLSERKDLHNFNTFSKLVIVQQITITYMDNDYLVWNLSKFSTGLFDEFDGSAPKNLICELTSEPHTEPLKRMIRSTSCKWESE